MIPVSTTTAYQDLLQNQRWDAVFWYDSPLELLGSLRTLQQFSLLTPFIVITEQAQTAFDAVRLGAAAASKAVLVAVLERELLHREEKEALSGYMGELSSLYRATSILFANLTSSTLDEVAHQIVDAVVRAFGRVECGVLLFDDTGSLTCAACTPSYHDEGPVLEAVKTGQVIYLPGTEQLASELILPMETAQGLVGVLDLQSRNHFEEQDRRALYSFAVRAAMAVENVRLYEAVKAYTLVLERRVAERTNQVSRAKEQVEAVLNSSSEAIILTKTDGTIRQTNPAFDALFGYQIDETFGVPLAQLIKPDQAGPFMAVFQAVIRGKSTRTLEVTARRKDGTLVDVEVGLSVIVDEDDEASRVVCSFHDISKHKEIEETLRLALEHERELSELTSRFITMVSHEFRTPLATILVTVDSLRSYIDRMTVEQRSSKFVKIQAQIQHMTTLLEEVLELSRDSASEPLALEEVNLDELCQEIISQFRATAPKHDFVYVQVGGQPYLRLDPRLIQQTITALLSNAVKFSPPGREVQIRLDCTGNPIQLQVKDSGIGIPEPDQKHMFQAFHRARNADTIPGTGLSLALVKQAVTRHQGDITFESKVGVGTTFTVTLSRNVSDDQNSFN